MKNLKRVISKPIFLLGLLILAAIAIRLWLISGHDISFFYDQARDAIHATNISQGDLMIFGPTASGTKDTVFHGVLWYYFLAPFYALSPDPLVAVHGLAVLSSLYLIVIYFLAHRIFRQSHYALLVTALMAFSSLVAVNSTWLSNPTLIYFFFPPFIYFAYQSYQQLTVKNFALSCLFLGLLTQAAIFQVYWGILLVIVLFRHFKLKNMWPAILAGGGTFILTISSMILAEALMIKRGILSLAILKDFDAAPLSSGLADALSGLIDVYGTVMARSFLPQFLVASFVIGLGFLYLSVKQPTPRRRYLLLVAVIPLVFLAIVFRRNYHLLAGMEFLFYLILADTIISRRHQYKAQVIIILLVTFAAFNFAQLYKFKSNGLHYVNHQKGSFLSDQMALIDETYRQANYEPFTFSSSTNPAGIDITWHYLYHWYGQEKYGYQPTFIGPSQDGYLHAGLLAETTDYQLLSPHHFTILENETGLAKSLELEFLAEQRRLAGTPSAELSFGELKLLEYQAVALE